MSSSSKANAEPFVRPPNVQKVVVLPIRAEAWDTHILPPIALMTRVRTPVSHLAPTLLHRRL